MPNTSAERGDSSKQSAEPSARPSGKQSGGQSGGQPGKRSGGQPAGKVTGKAANFALVLEDDATLANALARVVKSLGYDVAIAGTIARARRQIDEREPTVMLVDVNLPDGDGLEFMAELQETVRPNFVVITGDSSQQVAVKCIRAKAFDMLPKPIRLEDLKRAVGRAIDAREQETLGLDTANADSIPRVDTSTIAVGASGASEDLRTMIRQAANMQKCLVVVEGETGTEKNAVAEAIHVRSKRLGRLITVNCAGEKDPSAHSRFFGVEDASTGEAKHQGYLEQAGAGTLVLDDVTELSRDLQARLLAFMDNGQFIRTGGVQPMRAKVGVIGIARASVKEALESGALREDFYYRLAQFSVRVPRLNQRSDDKLVIAEHLLREINERNGTHKTLSEQARQAISDYAWPGNVRELKNALHRACMESDAASRIDLKGLEENAAADSQNQQIGEFIGKTFWQIEKELLYATLDHHNGDKEKTAKMLGISLKTLYNRLHAYS